MANQDPSEYFEKRQKLIFEIINSDLKTGQEMLANLEKVNSFSNAMKLNLIGIFTSIKSKVDELVHGQLIVMSTTAKLEEIALRIDSQTSRSYANIVSTQQHIKPKITKKPELPHHCIIISSSTVGDDGQAIRDKLKNAIDPARLKIGFRSIRAVQNNKVIMECDSKLQCNQVKTALASDQELTASDSTMKWPTIMISNVPNDIQNDLIEKQLQEQNDDVSSLYADLQLQSCMKFKFAKKARAAGLKHVVFEVQPNLRKLLVERRHISLGFSKVLVYDHSPIIRCYGCLALEHTSAFCPMKAELNGKVLCIHCGLEHKLESCPDKEDKSKAKCMNCTRANDRFKNLNRNTNHRSNDNHCEEFKRRTKLINERIDWGHELVYPNLAMSNASRSSNKRHRGDVSEQSDVIEQHQEDDNMQLESNG